MGVEVNVSGPRRFVTADEIDLYQWECVEIDAFAIQEEYMRLPADLAYWNERYASVHRHWLEMKAKRERVYAERLMVVRQGLQFELDSDPLKKGRITISEVEVGVMRDDAYMAVRDKEISAEAEKIRLWGVLDAIRAKKDMLVSLGAHMRAEMAGGLSTREPSY